LPGAKFLAACQLRRKEEELKKKNEEGTHRRRVRTGESGPEEESGTIAERNRMYDSPDVLFG